MSLKDYSTTAGSNTSSPPNGWPEGMTLANVNNTARQMMADIRQLAAEDTIASATTCDLGTKDATFLTVSGTTTITGFGTVSAGIYKFVRFSGALTLTHNATSLILLTAANRTTVAGDIGLYKSEGSGNWREYFYSAQGSYQPLDSDLTAIAALTTTAYGRAFLELADAAAGRTALELATVGQAEAEAGTATTTRAWTAERVAQAIAALADSGITLTTGAAPYYGCRAWVNFNGTGTVAINASGNVSSITDNGTGDYTINFTTAMPDANYAVSGSTMRGTSNNDNDLYLPLSGTYTAAACQVNTAASSSSVTLYDCAIVNVFFIR